MLHIIRNELSKGKEPVPFEPHLLSGAGRSSSMTHATRRCSLIHSRKTAPTRLDNTPWFLVEQLLVGPGIKKALADCAGSVTNQLQAALHAATWALSSCLLRIAITSSRSHPKLGLRLWYSEAHSSASSGIPCETSSTNLSTNPHPAFSASRLLTSSATERSLVAAETNPSNNPVRPQLIAGLRTTGSQPFSLFPSLL